MRTATARRPSRAWSGSGRAVTCSASNVRGFGRSVDAVPYPSPAGWLLTGVRSPDTSVLRGAVCDYVRATEVADALGVSTLRAVRHGVSLAGGLALMAEAVAPRADLLALGVPTRCGEEVLVEDAYPSAHPRRRTARTRAGAAGCADPASTRALFQLLQQLGLNPISCCRAGHVPVTRSSAPALQDLRQERPGRVHAPGTARLDLPPGGGARHDVYCCLDASGAPRPSTPATGPATKDTSAAA
jgi:hypothetical protein